MTSREFLNDKIAYWTAEEKKLDFRDPHFQSKAKMCQDALEVYKEELRRKEPPVQTTLKAVLR